MRFRIRRSISARLDRSSGEQNEMAIPSFPARAVRPIRCQRVVAVNHGENPRADRNVGTAQPVGVSAAVPALVMMSHDRNDGIRERHLREDLRADGGMGLHPFELGSRQPSRLVQDVLRNGELADVVEERRRLERLELQLVLQANPLRQDERAGVHATDVVVRDRVLRVDGVREVQNRIDVLPVSTFDEDLRYRIARAIYGNPSFWRYAARANPPIHIIVERGRVTLTGVVNSNVERMLARSLATGWGELSVSNELKTDDEVRIN